MSQPSEPSLRCGRSLRCWRVPLLVAACFFWGSPLQLSAQTGTLFRRAMVSTTAPEPVEGVLWKLSSGRLTVVNDKSHEFTLQQLVRVDFTERVGRLPSDSPLIILVNGDLLVAGVVQADQERLLVRWGRLSSLEEFSIPLEAIQAILLTRDSEAIERRVWSRLQTDRRPVDEVLFANGDTLTGELTKITTQTLELQGESSPGTLPRESAVAVLFNPDLSDLPPLVGPGVLVTLLDGSRFRARQVELVRGERFSIKTLFGADLNLPVSAVCSLQFLGGPAAWVADLTPSATEFTPYLSLEWPWRRDRNCLGQPLRLRGRTYASGLGVHSRQRLTYDLKKKYSTLRGVVGVDDSAGGRGAVVFEVRLDGRPLWTSPVLRGGEDPLTLPGLSVKGGQSLELGAEFGPKGDVLDHADWCDLVLVQ